MLTGVAATTPTDGVNASVSLAGVGALLGQATIGSLQTYFVLLVRLAMAAMDGYPEDPGYRRTITSRQIVIATTTGSSCSGVISTPNSPRGRKRRLVADAITWPS